jgi:hypothetical protein
VIVSLALTPIVKGSLGASIRVSAAHREAGVSLAPTPIVRNRRTANSHSGAL